MKHPRVDVSCPFCHRTVGTRPTRGPGEPLMARHMTMTKTGVITRTVCDGSGLGEQTARQIKTSRANR